MKRPWIALIGLSIPLCVIAVAGEACSDHIETEPPSEGGGGAASTAATLSTSSGAGAADAGHDAFIDYTDPGCPDAGRPLTDFRCDPYHQHDGECPGDQACYIAVVYPSEPCGQETYSSYCAAAGSGGQGTPCEGAETCMGGFVCVVSGSGNQCVQLCPLTGPDGCTGGAVCEPIDVEGFGGCL